MSKHYELKRLREQRGKVKAELESLGTKLRKEERAMSAEEKAGFDKLKEEWVKLGDQIRAVETQLAELDSLLQQDAPADPPPADAPAAIAGRSHANHDPERRAALPGGDGAELAQRASDRKAAFKAWARAQHGLPLTAGQKAACQRHGISPRAKEFAFRFERPGVGVQRREHSASTGSLGGHTVKEDFSGVLEQALVDFSNVRGVCDILTTNTGADLSYPTEDDTGNTGERIGENTEVAYADDTFSSVTFGDYKYSSKGLLVPVELMEDSEFDLEPLLGQRAGERIGRKQGADFTTGTGTSQPKGVVTCASAGITTAGATAFTASELTRLAFSVDPAYRNGPKVGYMMHDSVIAYALTLLDSQNRPLLRESFRDGAKPGDLMVNGFPVYPNQFMTAATAGGAMVTATKHVLFGDYSKFKIRDVGRVRIRRLDERYADKDQVGFIAFMRSDSNCVNTAAIKYLLQA